MYRDDPHIELHRVPAFRRAGDVDMLDRWMPAREHRDRTRADRLVVGLGRAMRAYVVGDVVTAATDLEEVVPPVSNMGDSLAQTALFGEAERIVLRRLDSRKIAKLVATAA